MEFFDWSILGTFTGSVFAVALLTEITKGIPGISKIPTQAWSYILAVVVLIGAKAFVEDISVASVCLSVINAAMVSLAANGGHQALDRIVAGLSNEKYKGD